MNARIFAVSQGNDRQDSDRLFNQLDREFTGWDDPATRLMQALEQDELALYAQPILALREPEGFPMAEVLVRLRQAVARLARHPSGPCLSVNISAQTLGDPEFLPEIAAEFARTKVRLRLARIRDQRAGRA